MTRKVSGFLTKSGQFFATKLEAQLMEATTDFHDKLIAHLEQVGITGTVQDFVVDKVREFVLINKDAVKAYITLVQSIPEVQTHDIRSVLLQPTTGPVAAVSSEDEDDFVSAFSNPLGPDDDSTTTEGILPLVGQSEQSSSGDNQ